MGLRQTRVRSCWVSHGKGNSQRKVFSFLPDEYVSLFMGGKNKNVSLYLLTSGCTSVSRNNIKYFKHISMHCSTEYVKIAHTFFPMSSSFSFKHIQESKTFITCQSP